MSLDENEIPGYKVGKRIGRGGMATVYLAMQQPMNRQVALKIMSSQLGEDSVWAKRFIQEAQVIAQLTHPNVVPVFDVGAHEGRYYIAMEYLLDGSLKDKMKHGILIPEVLRIVAGVAAGLDYAGEKGFVHRDIKPDNIMFRDDGSPVILDFGIVKQMDSGPSGMTQTGVIVGTTSYMSPEQAQGRELDQRSDIYALGVMFFELLTGRPPYKGETDVGTLLMHVNDPLPELPKPLSVFQPIVNKALAKDPFHRYTRAREMIDHIQQLEPEIKKTISRLKVGNASDPTLVKKNKDLADEDATLVMSQGDSSNTGSTHHITTEEELTKVLSSAKATIKDFSSESRARKARRTRNLILSVSVVAISAISYVGYQQLVIVPQERAHAEALIREVEMKTQRKVDSLIAEAKKAREGLLPTETDRVDNIIAIYKQVLKLDSDNKEAEFTLEKFGDRYIEMAKTAVRRRDIKKAITYRDYAEQLVPTSAELPGLRSMIKSLRAEELDREFFQEEVNNLLAVAKTDIKQSKGFPDSAYTKLQQVLRIDPDNNTARKLTDMILEKLYKQTESDISRGRLGNVRSDIKILERYYEDPIKVAELNVKFSNVSSTLAKNDKFERLEKRAKRLLREKRTLSVNDELRDVYLSMKKLDRMSREVKSGLNDTSDFDAGIARKAIDERDFNRADQQIDIIEKYTPRYAILAALKTQLKNARASSEKSSQFITEAKRYMNANRSGDFKRADLASAYAAIEKSRSVDNKNINISGTLMDLENLYVTEIKRLISSNNKELLSAYTRDTQLKDWPSDRLFQLELLAKKPVKKPKRVLTGGF